MSFTWSRRFCLLFLFLLLASCNRLDTPASLLARLPTADATAVSIDFRALRAGGILKLLSAAGGTESDYTNFVKNTGFDYQRDLDSAMAAFSPSGTYFLVRGRFDWNKLADYARANQGSCDGDFCRMPGSTPERRISFFPLKKDLMALAVSTDDRAAERLKKANPQRPIAIPSQPVWLSASSSALARSSSLQTGPRMFAATLAKANEVLITLGPKDSDYEIRLEAGFATDRDAEVAASQLTSLTHLLHDFAGRKSEDLAALLGSGSFQHSGPKVTGYWPVRKQFLESLAGGG